MSADLQPPQADINLCLEVPCERCAGMGGKRLPSGSWIDCVKCDGLGKVLTPFGRNVLSLVARRYRGGKWNSDATEA